MKRASDVDMLNGPIAVNMVLLAIPIFLGAALQQLFNAADMIVIGRFAGESSLAAVGSNTFIINLMVNLFVGLSVGSNVVTAKLLGKGDSRGVSDAVHTSILLAIICGLALSVIGWVVARPVLSLMNTPQEIMADAVTYFRIYFLGMPFFLLYNFESAVLRSKGDTRRPLYVLAASGVVNILLNLLFVIKCKLGVAGVAWATVISSCLCSLMLLVMLMREDGWLKVQLKKLAVNSQSLKEIVAIGLPAGIQGLIFSFSNVVIQGAVNSLGTNAVAATTAALYTDYAAFFVMTAINQSTMAFMSQNYGAANQARCRRIIKASIILDLICVTATSWIMILLRRKVVAIFCPAPEVIELASNRVIIVLCLYILNGINDLCSSLMRTVGHSLEPALICIIGICGARLLWVALVFPSHHTFGWLNCCYPISWLVTLCVMLPIAVHSLKRSLKALS